MQIQFKLIRVTHESTHQEISQNWTFNPIQLYLLQVNHVFDNSKFQISAAVCHEFSAPRNSDLRSE